MCASRWSTDLSSVHQNSKQTCSCALLGALPLKASGASVEKALREAFQIWEWREKKASKSSIIFNTIIVGAWFGKVAKHLSTHELQITCS